MDFDAAISFYHSNEKFFTKSEGSEKLHMELSNALDLLIAHKYQRISQLRAYILKLKIRFQYRSRN